MDEDKKEKQRQARQLKKDEKERTTKEALEKKERQAFWGKLSLEEVLVKDRLLKKAKANTERLAKGEAILRKQKADQQRLIEYFLGGHSTGSASGLVISMGRAVGSASLHVAVGPTIAYRSATSPHQPVYVLSNDPALLSYRTTMIDIMWKQMKPYLIVPTSTLITLIQNEGR